MRSSARLGSLFLFAAIGLHFSQVSHARVWATPAQITPTPTVAPTVTPVPGQGKAVPLPQSTAVRQTVGDLQNRIRTILARPELRRGMIGIKVVSLNSGKTIFEDNAEKYLSRKILNACLE
jgi:hypothetical protein